MQMLRPTATMRRHHRRSMPPMPRRRPASTTHRRSMAPRRITLTRRVLAGGAPPLPLRWERGLGVRAVGNHHRRPRMPATPVRKKRPLHSYSCRGGTPNRIWDGNDGRNRAPVAGDNDRATINLLDVFGKRLGRIRKLNGSRCHNWISSPPIYTRLRRLIPTARMKTIGSGD